MHKDDNRMLFFEHTDFLDKKPPSYEFIQKNGSTRIGAFLHHDISTTEYSKDDFGLKVDFEYVEVMLTESKETEYVNEEVEWKALDDVMDKMLDRYDKLSGIDQKALPMVLGYFMDERGNSDNK